MVFLIIGILLGYIIGQMNGQKQYNIKLDENKQEYQQALVKMKQFYENGGKTEEQQANAQPTNHIGFVINSNKAN